MPRPTKTLTTDDRIVRSIKEADWGICQMAAAPGGHANARMAVDALVNIKHWCFAHGVDYAAIEKESHAKYWDDLERHRRAQIQRDTEAAHHNFAGVS